MYMQRIIWYFKVRPPDKNVVEQFLHIAIGLILALMALETDRRHKEYEKRVPKRDVSKLFLWSG